MYGVPVICGGREMKRSYLLLQFAGILFFLLLMTAQVQAKQDRNTHTLAVEIPEILQLEMGSGEIAFNLAQAKAEQPYPAPVYPAYYMPTSSNQYLPVYVFANGETLWRLLINGETARGLGAGAIEWSLDEVNWQPLALTERVLTEGSYTNGWREIKVYFRLVLRGGEYASSE
jgi:hypothetical protein